LKLGKPDDKPEFNTISWFAMLFSAGMGIGLVFYGAAETLVYHQVCQVLISQLD
jgi:glycine betaine transporter